MLYKIYKHILELNVPEKNKTMNTFPNNECYRIFSLKNTQIRYNLARSTCVRVVNFVLLLILSVFEID